jgi:hypothetical protein
MRNPPNVLMWGGSPDPRPTPCTLEIYSAARWERQRRPAQESAGRGVAPQRVVCEATSRGEFAPGNRAPVQGLMKHHIGWA